MLTAPKPLSTAASATPKTLRRATAWRMAAGDHSSRSGQSDDRTTAQTPHAAAHDDDDDEEEGPGW